MRQATVAAAVTLLGFTLGCMSEEPPEVVQVPVIEPANIEPPKVLVAGGGSRSKWAPGAQVGPLDPDPNLPGDEINAGQWAFGGIIYDHDGTIFGCEGGGNWCGGPPPGSAEAAIPGMPAGFPERLRAVTLVDGSWHQWSGCRATALMSFSQNRDGKLQVEFLNGDSTVATVQSFVETPKGYALDVVGADGASSAVTIERSGASPAWTVTRGDDRLDYGPEMWTAGLGLWQQPGCQ